jgi:hypothetical protein
VPVAAPCNLEVHRIALVCFRYVLCMVVMVAYGSNIPSTHAKKQHKNCAVKSFLRNCRLQLLSGGCCWKASPLRGRVGEFPIGPQVRLKSPDMSQDVSEPEASPTRGGVPAGDRKLLSLGRANPFSFQFPTAIRGFPARNTRSVNPRPFSNGSTLAVTSRTG